MAELLDHYRPRVVRLPARKGGGDAETNVVLRGFGLARHGVCPWWVGYFLVSPLRRLMQDPARLLAPYVHAGATVLEVGPGMGFFTLELARLVGPTGRVIAVDVEPRMINGLQRRARRAGLSDCIDARVVQPTSMDLGDAKETIDFVFAFAVVHEMPTPALFFIDAVRAMKPGAAFLLAEPSSHADDEKFVAELAAAAQAGLIVISRRLLRGSYAALLFKPGTWSG